MRSALPIFALAILVSGVMLRPALAATASGSFGVSATVQATCRASAKTTAFKTYASAAANTASPVSVTCSNSAPYSVNLTAGMGFGAIVTNREMTGSGSALLGYLLSSNPQRIINWGQGKGTDTLAGSSSGSARVLAIHGQISADHGAADGVYANTIIVTVTY